MGGMLSLSRHEGKQEGGYGVALFRWWLGDEKEAPHFFCAGEWRGREEREALFRVFHSLYNRSVGAPKL